MEIPFTVFAVIERSQATDNDDWGHWLHEQQLTPLYSSIDKAELAVKKQLEIQQAWIDSEAEPGRDFSYFQNRIDTNEVEIAEGYGSSKRVETMEWFYIKPIEVH